MRQVFVRRVSMQAFRSVQELQVRGGLPTSGLVGIKGLDASTGVSSGTGKSTFGLAIAYALGYCPFPASKQQNWHTKLPMQVTLELDTPEGPAVLKRGKEFSLTWNGQTYKGSAKVVEEAVTRMMGGLNSDLLAALTYRQQRTPGRFLGMTDAEKKEFLGTLLGTSELEARIEEAVKESNSLRSQAELEQKLVEQLKRILTPPVKPETNVEAQRAELERAMARIAELKASEVVLQPPPTDTVGDDEIRIIRLIEDCEVRVNDAKIKADIDKRQLSGLAKDTLSKLDSGKKAVSKIPTLQKQRSALLMENEKLAQSKCPTCSREWEESEAKLLKNEDFVRNIDAELAQLNLLEHEIIVLEEEYRLRLESWNGFKSEKLEKLTAILVKLREDLAAVGSARRIEYDQTICSYRNTKEQIRAEVSSLQAVISATSNAIRNAEAYQMAYESAIRKYERDEQELHAKQELLTKLTWSANEKADLADMYRGFLGAIFDEVLAEVSEHTNDLIQNIPNVPTVSVTFTSEVVTGKGTTKREIRPIIIKDGVVVEDYKSGLSGGQLTAVELAIDLSIAKVIGRRKGFRPGFMIFDEAFDGGCPTVKEACLEVLARSAQDCMILVVEHGSEAKEYFTQFVNVEFRHGVTRIS